MKKCIVMFLCACILCSLSVTAFASEGEPDYIAEYEAQYGKMPDASDYSSNEEYQAVYDVWLAGFKPYTERRYEEWLRQKEEAEEAARKSAEEQTVPAETTPTKPVKSSESAGSKHENNDFPSDYYTGSDYPVGSIVDADGIVWSPDGTRLSPVREPGTTPAMEPLDAPASGLPQNAALLSGELADQDGLSPDPDSDTLPVEQPVFTVKDLRPVDAPAEVLTGLKALVTSIFGEYMPVTTTSVISETVGNDTNQYLVETVAPGAAGVDYEWISGVLLFAIMLYCFMKLLGGVLK